MDKSKIYSQKMLKDIATALQEAKRLMEKRLGDEIVDVLPKYYNTDPKTMALWTISSTAQ